LRQTDNLSPKENKNTEKKIKERKSSSVCAISELDLLAHSLPLFLISSFFFRTRTRY
jgi:hypothetical protein